MDILSSASEGRIVASAEGSQRRMEADPDCRLVGAVPTGAGREPGGLRRENGGMFQDVIHIASR